MTISFEIPSRQDLGTKIPIVASGKQSPVEMTDERSAIEANYGYLIPCHGSKSKHFDRINMILLVSARLFHEKIYMT